MPVSQALPFDTTAPSNVAPGLGAAGTETTVARGDHVHDVTWSGVAPSISAPGDAASTGAAQGLNRRDHVHGREAMASQAEMEAGTEAAARAVSPLRVAQAIAALAAGGGAHAASHENGGADEISIAGLDGTPVELTNHLSDATDAHDASAISVTPAGGITSTDVQAALVELDGDIAAGGIPATILDAKGDLIAASAADTAARLAVGADNTILMAASGETTGLKWFAHTTVDATLGADVTMTNANQFYDGPTAGSLAIGTWLVWGRVAIAGTAASQQHVVRITDGSTHYAESEFSDQGAGAGYVQSGHVFALIVLAGATTIKLQAAAIRAGCTMKRNTTANSGSTNSASHIVAYKIA